MFPNGADEAIRSLGQEQLLTKSGRNPAHILGSSPIFTSEKYRP
jgi:hypothetical protein